jgi:hypothetical protein
MAAPTLTGFSTMDPSPRVEVLFPSSALASGTETITVWQLSSDGSRKVRTDSGSDRVYAVGGVQVTDYEVPPGVTVEYRAEQFNSAGVSLGFTDTEQVQVDFDPSMAVIQDPLLPGNAVLVEVKPDFGSGYAPERELQLHRIGFDTIALMAAQGLARDVPVTVQTKTLEDAQKLRAILAETYVLVRTMPAPLPLIPRCLHVVIASPRPVPIDVHYGGEWVQWPLTGQEVTRSSLSIIVPTVTWQDVIDTYPTWTALMAAHGTWLDLQTNLPGS